MFQSPQAITISIFYFIMFLIVAFLAFKHMHALDALKVLTPFLITTLLLIYDTECLVTGGCYVYSWIRTILYLISIIIVIVSLTFFTASSIVSAVDQAQPTNVVTTTDKPAQTSTTTPATPTTTPITTTATPTTTTPATTPIATTATPVATTTKTTEKFALWENYSDVNDNEDFTQMFYTLEDLKRRFSLPEHNAETRHTTIFM